MTIPRMYAHSLIGDAIEATLLSSMGVGNEPGDDDNPDYDSTPATEGPSELRADCINCGKPGVGPLLFCDACEAGNAAQMAEQEEDASPPARCPFCNGYAHARACAPLYVALFSETRCPSCGDPSYGRLCCACVESSERELAREDILVAAATEIYTTQHALDAILRLRANAAWFARRSLV